MKGTSRALRVTLLIATVTAVHPSAAQRPASCGATDSAAAEIIRNRLQLWVTQTNSGDAAGANTIWAPKVDGWFPSGREFSDSAGRALAGVTGSTERPKVTMGLKIESVDVGGWVAAVHDIWTDRRRYPGATVDVTREIRGSELWRCQPDGTWRIARWVSAVEHWARQ